MYKQGSRGALDARAAQVASTSVLERRRSTHILFTVPIYAKWVGCGTDLAFWV